MKVRLPPFPPQVPITLDNSLNPSDLRDLVTAAVSADPSSSSSQRARLGLMADSGVEVEVEVAGEVAVETLEAKIPDLEDEAGPEEDEEGLLAKVAPARAAPLPGRR